MSRLGVSCVYLSPYLLDRDSGGGLLSRLNVECLRRSVEHTEALVLSNQPSSASHTSLGAPRGRLFTAMCNLVLHCGRLTPLGLYRVMRRLLRSKPDLLFVDSSSLGWVVLLSRVLLRRTHVLVFSHNVEFDFQVERARLDGRAYLLSAGAEFVNEWLMARFAHTLVTLTQEDSERYGALYRRPGEALMPVSLEDRGRIGNPAALADRWAGDFVLFVGSNFFANREAAAYLVRELAPRLGGEGGTEIWIAGSGFTSDEWGQPLPANVRMLGRVDDLAPLYRRAVAFVAPVFSGAGMKVKVAEALMHGCPVVGSELALRGYRDGEARPYLREAGTPEQYRAAIEACRSAGASWREPARSDFVDRFSIDAAVSRTRRLLEVRLAGRH